jgi:outer membrane protein assembly factor BamB
LPVSNKEMLFVLSGRPGPCQTIRLPGEGDVTRSHVVWSSVRKGHRDVSSPILWQGRIYTADSRGGNLSCYDLNSGKELYSARLGGKSLSSPIALRGTLLFLLDNGVTVILEPGGTFREVRRNRLGEGSDLDFGASPAVADGRLFLRSQSYLYCIGEKK